MSESEVLHEFLNSPPNNGVLVAPVLGESGAGKSHLIRWAKAKIPEKQGRHVIYLQKTETSLKDVVEALLVNQHDPELEEIRRRVAGLGSGTTLDELEHKILAELAEALRTAEADNPYGKALVGENGLRLFFIDPLFEQHLLRPGSFIKRRAEHALRGRGADEPDVPLEFTIEELPLDIVDNANIQDAAAPTQRLFTRLVPNAGMQREAVRLLNDYLDVAVTKAASLNVGDIGHAFKTIREKLVGQEIVLLIEDVALIQGVRRDLLDAIVEVGVIRGIERYATVRTMMAVTPGYYNEQLPETFRRRAEASSPIYQVDVDLGSERNGKEQEDLLVDFVGRYLNAARVGKDGLESAFPVVPNACHSCEVRPSCHSAFGNSGSGDAEYGLYPYNRPAILRAIRACAARDGARVLFNPRRVLARAIRDTLTGNAARIEEGAFPPPDFLAEEAVHMDLPQLSTYLREQIEDQYPDEEAGRIESLLTFWGSVGAEQISDEILRAFSRPPISINLARGQVPTDPDAAGAGAASVDSDTRRATGELPRSVQKQLDDIDAWSQGRKLPQALARELRKIVREALLLRIDWFDPVIKEPDTRTMTRAVPENARGVFIAGADTKLLPGAAPLVHVEQTARNATTLRGLVLIKEGHPAWAGDALARLDALVSGSVDEAKRRVLAELAVDDASLTQAAASLITGAAACGVLPERPRDIDYVNACLWRGGSDRADAPARTPTWLAAYGEYMAARDAAVDRLMSGVGAAQGTGGVHAIDPLRLMAIVRKAKAVAESQEDPEVPAWGSEAQKRLKALIRANAQQLALWQDLLVRIRRHLPEDTTFTETVAAIVEAVSSGQDQGLVKVADLHALEALNSIARTWESRGIRDIEGLLARVEDQSGLARLRSLGTEAGADLPKIADFLESSSQWIEAGIRTAETDVGSVADVDAQLTRTIETWLEIARGSES